MKPVFVHLPIAMKPIRSPRPRLQLRAFTLVELTMVICVLLGLIGISLYSSTAIKTWRLGREASETLRGVYSAQRLYLSDNPMASVTTLTDDLLKPYLPNKATAMPTVKSLTGSTLVIKVTAYPPVLTSSGVVYDPSGSSTDSLWDVGE